MTVRVFGCLILISIDFYDLNSSLVLVLTEKINQTRRGVFDHISKHSNFVKNNLVLSTGSIMRIGHRKEVRKLAFQALALRQSESNSTAYRIINSLLCVWKCGQTRSFNCV